MKCVISGANLKTFGRAIHSLSKIGDELFIEALEDGFSLRTLNLARSAYACVHFLPEFFMVYKDLNAPQNPSLSDSTLVLKCKIYLKPVYYIFKTLQQMDKTVDRCEVKLDLKLDKLIFKMHCKHGITKTHYLPFIECDAIEAVFTKAEKHNFISCQSKFLQDVVMNFQPNLEEITFSIFTDKAVITNYIENEADQKLTKTELVLLNHEFDVYNCIVECKLTFCIKEFKALLLFAEPINLPISIYFDEAGSPMILSCETETCFKVDFVLATLADTATILSQKAAFVPSPVAIKNKGPGAKNSKLKQTKMTKAKPGDNILVSKENRVSIDKLQLNSTVDDSFDSSFNALKHLLAFHPKSNNDVSSMPNHSATTSQDTCKNNNDVSRMPIHSNVTSHEVNAHKSCNWNVCINSLSNNFTNNTPAVIKFNDEISVRPRAHKLFSNFLTSDDAMEDDEDDDVYSDIIPFNNALMKESVEQSPPPNKKFRSLFFGFSQDSAADVGTQNRPSILVSDSDED